MPIPTVRRERDKLTKNGGRYYGMISAVARQLDVSESAVTQTWHDPKVSRRIRAAIEAEMDRRDQAAQQEQVV